MEKNNINYYITGLYKDIDNEEYNKLNKFKQVPPILNIFDENGNNVEIELTKEFSKILYEDLKNVNRAYNGFIYQKQKINLFEKIKNIPSDFKKHPMGYIIILIVTFCFIVFGILK